MFSFLKTIKFKLFFSYSILILIIIFILSYLFYSFTSNNLINKSFESISELSKHISTQLDDELNELDSISKTIISSSTIRENFFKDLSNMDSSSKISNQSIVNKTLYSIIGIENSFFQINLISKEGRNLRIGQEYFDKATLSTPLIFEEDMLKNSGHKYISKPYRTQLRYSDEIVISLDRAFSQDLNQKLNGYILVEQKYSVFSNFIENLLSTNKNKSAYIFNDEGDLIYPYKDYDLSYCTSLWSSIKEETKKQNSNSLSLVNSSTKEVEIIAYNYSPYSQWTTVLVESQKSLFSPFITFKNNTLIIMFIGLFVTLCISYFLARGLTLPITKIHRSIKGLSLDNLSSEKINNLNSNYNELEELNIEYQEMCKRLDQAIKTEITSKAKATESRMNALQSKMNPHFLYNMISHIHILAGMNRNDNISSICENLSDILRYILDNNSTVTLKDEIDNALNYLILMKYRFEDSLEYTIDIPSSLYEIKVLKLIVQPILENSMKYSVSVLPPWKISIKGEDINDKWILTITDNGPGFSKDALIKINKVFLELNSLDYIPSLEGNGIGLINIFTRLKILYGNDAIFKISNSKAGGAIITLGGVKNEDKEEINGQGIF